MSVVEPDERNALTTKSSMEIAKTMIALATIAGVSIGRSASRSACTGDAPRSWAASSYSGPIESRRARTMMSTNESEKVTWPIACAVVPSGMNVSRFTKTRKSATPMTISGRHERHERRRSGTSRRRARASA